MTSRERDKYERARLVFEELLDDFNSKGLLRKGIPRDLRERLARMWRQSRQMAKALNAVWKIFDRKVIESVAAETGKFGLDEQVFTDIFFSQIVALFLYDIETVLRASLIFFLEENQNFKKKMELGPLLKAIKKVSPDIEAKLRPLIDIKLRNALAHGAFWSEKGGEVYLAKNSHLTCIKNLTLHEFMIRTKKQNIVSHAFIHVLSEKINQNYFRAS